MQVVVVVVDGTHLSAFLTNQQSSAVNSSPV